MNIAARRARIGRFQLYVEPRDLWVGVFVGPDAVYICPLPCLVLRMTRPPRT